MGGFRSRSRSGAVVQQNKNMLLGKLAVREGLCTQEEVDESLRMQQVGHVEGPLGDVLLYKGCLSAAQLKELLGRQHTKVMACLACRLSFTVVTLSDGRSS